jgi:hypothetical protein
MGKLRQLPGVFAPSTGLGESMMIVTEPVKLANSGAKKEAPSALKSRRKREGWIHMNWVCRRGGE